MDDLLPRKDISGLITGKLVQQLGSSNPKERMKAVDDVDEVVRGAGGRIANPVAAASHMGSSLRPPGPPRLPSAAAPLQEGEEEAVVANPSRRPGRGGGSDIEWA